MEALFMKDYKSLVVWNGIAWFASLLFSKPQQAWLRVFWNHYKNVPLFCVFTLLKLLWLPIEALKIRMLSEKCGENQVEIRKVLWTCKALSMDIPRLAYYWTTHQAFAEAEAVLNENVFLAKIFRDKAVFVDFGKPVHENYTAKKATFLWDEIVEDAQRLILVPICLFHRLADALPLQDQIDQHSDDLTVIYGTGRCGSTLLIKMFEHVSNEHLAYSEITTIFDLMTYHLRIPDAEFRRLMLSTIRFTCLSYAPTKRKICIKPLCLSVALARKIHEVVPNARFIFIHRDPIQTALAQERAFGLTICFRMSQLMHRLGGDWNGWFAERIKFYHNPRLDAVAHEIMPNPGIFETCLISYANHYLAYKEAAREFDFPALQYEEAFTDPEAFVRRALVLAGMEEDVRKGMEMLTSDSQHGKTLSQSRLNGFPVTTITPQLRQKVIRLCSELEMPLPRQLNGNRPSGIFPKNLSAIDGF